MPLPIILAHRLCERLAAMRRSSMTYLRPDGKSQVTVRYEDGVPQEVTSVVISTQHAPDVSAELLHDEVIGQVVRPVLEDFEMFRPTDIKYYINLTGLFVVGGPLGDAGLTGRKIIVDTYWGMARHGGGAFSGKDPSKVDRWRPTRLAGWRRTSWPPASRSAARSRWPTRSASPTRCR